DCVDQRVGRVPCARASFIGDGVEYPRPFATANLAQGPIADHRHEPIEASLAMLRTAKLVALSALVLFAHFAKGLGPIDGRVAAFCQTDLPLLSFSSGPRQRDLAHGADSTSARVAVATKSGDKHIGLI